jgi:hypothetical protein
MMMVRIPNDEQSQAVERDIDTNHVRIVDLSNFLIIISIKIDMEARLIDVQ